jgi:hypothetical protein
MSEQDRYGVIARTTVECTDNRHARGKSFKMVTLTFYADGRWGREAPRDRRNATLTRKAVSGRDVQRERITTMFGSDPVVCKLCGRRLPSDDQLDAAAPVLAARSIATITLDELVVVCAKAT